MLSEKKWQIIRNINLLRNAINFLSELHPAFDKSNNDIDEIVDEKEINRMGQLLNKWKDEFHLMLRDMD